MLVICWENDLWKMRVEIPYWWYVTTQSIWIVPLIGWSKFPTRHDWFSTNQRHSPDLGSDTSVVLEFQRSFPGRTFRGETSGSCLLRVHGWKKNNVPIVCCTRKAAVLLTSPSAKYDKTKQSKEQLDPYSRNYSVLCSVTWHPEVRYRN